MKQENREKNVTHETVYIKECARRVKFVGYKRI